MRVERRSVCLLHAAFKGSERSKKRDLSCEKCASDYTRRVPSSWKRSLEVIRRWLKRVVGGKFIESLSGVDELRNVRWRLEVRDTLGSHDALDCVFVLNEGDYSHLRFAFGALQGIDFIDAFYARGPATLRELPLFIGLCFSFWRGNKLSALASTPT